jgi:hypothetical protein
MKALSLALTFSLSCTIAFCQSTPASVQQDLLEKLQGQGPGRGDLRQVHNYPSMGWDASPRTNQHVSWDASYGYPYTPVIIHNTPAAFKQALNEAKRFMDKQPFKQKILTINSWNEWTEGSYLEPDTRNRFGYLKAIKEVFGRR